MATEGKDFKFHFLGDEPEDDNRATTPNLSAVEAKEINDWDRKNIGMLGFEKVEIWEGLELQKGIIKSSDAASILGEQSLAISDLVPNKYEGGFKLWEGALDLCRFLGTQYHLKESLGTPDLESKLYGKRVLELGCGHGLPGILALMAGANVHFQDFNEEVLQSLTIPNVMRNLQCLPAACHAGSPRYFAGDWLGVGGLLTRMHMGGYYDIILTSETLYSLESQEALLECIKQVLQPPHGVVYMASKTYYFGVGGGTKSFMDLVHEDGIFECTTVAKLEDGTSNKREVLQLKFPDSISPWFM